MSNNTREVALRTGTKIPVIGLGVYRSAPGEECYDAVLNALKIGYRHVDTAQFYHNEEDVGRAVKDSNIPRENVFITTKLWISNFGYQKAIDAITESVNKLQTPYIDLLLLHAPGEPSLRVETWRALEDLHKSGILKNVGVSNFGENHLEKLATHATVLPSVNQIELHPWLQRVELVKYCNDHGIVVQAYSPLAKANKLNDPVVVNIATRNNITTAQVLIAWSLHKGFVTLPKSVNTQRQLLNLQAQDITLSAQDIAELDGLEEYYTTGWDPIKTAPV